MRAKFHVGIIYVDPEIPEPVELADFIQDWEGATLLVQPKFCMFCGTKLDESQTMRDPRPVSESKSMSIDIFRGEHFFLSNFYPCLVPYEGLNYPSAEHAYQAAKSLNPRVREAIAALPDAKSAKRDGREISVRPDWEDVKIQIMENIVRVKFTGSKYLGERLVETFPHRIIHANWWGDTFWGVHRGNGEDHLGKILMKVRAEIMEGQA
jgi:ribA/ribD-fused uncharacterized protein